MYRRGPKKQVRLPFQLSRAGHPGNPDTMEMLVGAPANCHTDAQHLMQPIDCTASRSLLLRNTLPLQFVLSCRKFSRSIKCLGRLHLPSVATLRLIYIRLIPSSHCAGIRPSGSSKAPIAVLRMPSARDATSIVSYILLCKLRGSWQLAWRQGCRREQQC